MSVKKPEIKYLQQSKFPKIVNKYEDEFKRDYAKVLGVMTGVLVKKIVEFGNANPK